MPTVRSKHGSGPTGVCWVGRFSAQLYQLTGRRGMLILYAYALLGFGCLRAVTPDFGGLAQRVRLTSWAKGSQRSMDDTCFEDEMLFPPAVRLRMRAQLIVHPPAPCAGLRP